MEITEPTGVPGAFLPTGFPELTPLGKRIEMLRIERGLSKQHLARFAGTSRQQLWRVMTGKSELTSTLGQRLADALQIELRTLRGQETASTTTTTIATGTTAITTFGPATLADFIGEPGHVERALGALPADAPGQRLRATLLDAVAALAAEHAITLPSFFAELRERHVGD